MIKYKTAKSRSDKGKVVFRDILLKTGYYDRFPSKSYMSGCDNYIQNNLDDDVSRILNLDNILKGRGVEKVIIPSNIIDIYTRLNLLLGLKLSDHTNTLTEASNLFDELHKRGEIQKEQQYPNAFKKFQTVYMELPSKLLEQIAFNTRPKIEEHMLIVMDNITHEKHLSQPLQTINEQFKITVTFLTGYNGIFNVTEKKVNFISRKQLLTKRIIFK